MLPQTAVSDSTSPSETIRTKRRDQVIYLAGEYFLHQETTEVRAELNTAVGNGLVVAGKLRDRPHTRETILGRRAYANADFLDLRAFESRDHSPGTHQQFTAEEVTSGAAVEIPIDRIVMYEYVRWTVGTQVDA
jgi:hypothetical protein